MKNMRKALSILLSAAMVAGSASMPVLAYSNPQTDTSVSADEIAHAQTSMNIAKEGIVLLENNNGALPYAKGGPAALFGIGSIQTTKGGTGSGAVNNRIVYEDGKVVEGEAIATSVLDGFKNAGYDVLTEDYLKKLDEANPNDTTGLGMGKSDLADDTALDEMFSDEELKAMAEKTDTAFYTIRRNAGEGADRVKEKDYYLSDNEKNNIKKLSDTFDKVVVLLNVVSIDTSWFKDSGADAMVVISNPGELGGDAVVSVLDGETNPSGKLVDTWASSLEDWPSTAMFSDVNPDDPYGAEVEFYSEDVFVGYRYFDTFAADKINYNFGYGLSYTTFDIKTDEVKADADKITVKATVTNTGDRAGKEVVQVYFSAPDGTIPKPYQELAGYGKTDEIKPGESQTITISFDTSEMSSYSEEKAAYILEKGDYVIRVGNSSGNTTPAAVVTLDEDAVTEQLANKMAIDRSGKYAGGSSGKFDDQTQEKNVEEYNKLKSEFDEANKNGTSLDGGDTSGAIKLSLAASDIQAVNPYKDAGVDPDSSDVQAYISSTTEMDTVGEKGYDYALGKEYNIKPVYYDKDGNETNEKPDELADYSNATLLDVQKGDITLQQFISGLTISQMADIVEGGSKSPDAAGQSSGGASPNTADAGQDVVDYTNKEYVDGQAGQTVGLYIGSKKIPTMTNADGPAGLRISQSYKNLEGEDRYQYTTAYPIGTMIAQTWNTDLAYLMGENVGQEMEHYGVTQWLAPGMNIHRNPLCGRNFEYYSEDPLIAGLTGGYEALGVQSNSGVGVTFKHFAGNDQENSRNSQNDVVSERAFREIYLKQFEIAVKLSRPMGMMSTYGMVNGTPTANDHDLLESILRTEWGFDGLVMTDWGGSGGMTDAAAMHAGNDLIMPGHNTSTYITAYILDAAPNIPVDEQGLSTEGGYPHTTGRSRTFGTRVWNSVNTDWGDYTLDAEGAPYEVKTTKEAFENTMIKQVEEKEDKSTELVDKSVKDVVDGLKEAGTASYEEGDDGIVTITYKLKQASSSDKSHYSSEYTEHPITKSTNLLGQEDLNMLSLADLQKSTEHILKVLMRTMQWQEVLDQYGSESGEDMTQYKVGSYTDAVGGTTVPVTVEKG